MTAAPAPDPILESVQPIEPREVVPVVELRSAVLCVGCDGIYPATAGDCPRCHSVVRFAVARVISPSTAAPFPWLTKEYTEGVREEASRVERGAALGVSSPGESSAASSSEREPQEVNRPARSVRSPLLQVQDPAAEHPAAGASSPGASS